MKKIISIALTAALSLSMMVPVMADDNDDVSNTPSPTVSASPQATAKATKYSFTDIGTKDFEWAAPYIEAMYKKGLINGYEDNTFRPDNDVTRLECLSLFARAMGSADEVNEDILKIAHEKYDSIVYKYNLSWGDDEIVYLMYKGALKTTDLDTYLKGSEKDKPMQRYEAAIIITKAMGGEKEALSEMGVVLPYTDAKDIPSGAIQYVAYASDNGIMEGMDNNTFSPNTAVKRSQMAVMLSRTVDKTEYSYEKAKIVSLNTASKTIDIKLSDGTSKSVVYNNDTVMNVVGEEVQPIDMLTSVQAIFTYSGPEKNKTLVCVDTISSVADEVVTGKFKSYSSNSGIVTVRIIPTGEKETAAYECASDVTYTFDGSPATIRSFSEGDFVELSLSDGKVQTIAGEDKESTITNATIESIDTYPDITLTISHANDEYDGKTYYIANNVAVRKNNEPSSLSEIYKGDKVTLTLEYGEVVKIVATSTKQVVEGTIVNLSIGNSASMVVNVKGNEKTYDIPVGCEVLINGEEGTLYDFRVGDSVKLTIESNAITKISATSTQETSGQIVGVVTAVNASMGVISVKKDDGSIAQAYNKGSKMRIISSKTGDDVSMKDIKIGQSVDIRGSIDNGVFIGTLCIITSE